MSPLAGLLATTVLGLTLAGCGLHDPYNHSLNEPAVTAAPTQRAPTTSVPARSPTPGAVAPPRSGAAAILYRYAQTYGDLTPATAARRQRTLAALATGALEQQLRASISRAAELAERALPPGGSSAAVVESAEVGPVSGGRRRGVAILSQRLPTPGGAPGPPLTTVYVAQLERTVSGWRVASFVALP